MNTFKNYYFFKRILYCAVVFLISASITFAVLHLMPGDYIQSLMPYIAEINPEFSELFKEKFGLDRSLFEQYALYITNIFQGNWGYSFQYGAPVFDIIAEKLFWTMVILLPATVLSAVAGIVIGSYSGWKNGSKTDVCLLNAMVFIGAVPSYWWAIMAILVFSYSLGLFPLGGFVSLDALTSGIDPLDVLHHAVLPILVLTVSSIPGTYYFMRNSMLMTLGEGYILTARAKGVEEKNILRHHALKNAMLPMITVVSLQCAHMITGSIFIETIFSWPGLGLLTFDALSARDLPLLEGIFLMDTLVVIVANFAADLLYSMADPRIQVGSHE
ncbi:ABC transporter permease [Methanofollis formosanus]|uniref:ABC transporter permease n=1 Tax=Methanofollis formosanus TaxID=299308 RepID=A0A8G1A278_9EURY|nr:ABC transporter permease [Methanofollis formosanus]QYZ79358.1 ABC transporter permease [Methanofollis formosanus]